jgi:hypothetical protein
MVTASELPINTGATALQMANEIFGNGATVITANYSGDNRSSGIYSDGDATSPGVVPGDTGVILSTGRATDFTRSSGQSNQSTNTSTNTSGVNGDSDLNALAGSFTRDASILEIEFIPTGDTLSFQFIFASEEYPEFTNSIYNDIFGVFINGDAVDLAVNTTTSIGGINDNTNENLYNDNTSDQFNTEMDGFTVTMTLTLTVDPNVINTLKIGIADVGDSSYDSNVLIAGGSVQSDLLLGHDTYNVVQNGTPDLNVLDNDTNNIGGTLTITHINGIEVVAGVTVVTLATGQDLMLNVDGTINLVNDTDLETYSFTYTAEASGISDTAFVTITTIPCFVAGTLIETPTGAVSVETLAPGDLVATMDHGAQPLRWIGTRVVEAKGNMAPIRIAAGTFGAHELLLVSPQHRILIRDEYAELLFGEKEVLVAAKDLINDLTVRRDTSMPEVEYVHILFDRHQVVFSEGLASESFLPGPQSMQSFEDATVAEICHIFPQLDPATGNGYGASARVSLKAYEAQLLQRQAYAS